MNARLSRILAFARADRLARYLVAGGAGVAINIGLLYFFTDILQIWYLASAVASFSISVLASFLLQRFWTFQSRSQEGMHHQALYYLIVSLANLGLNTAILYVLVDFFGANYLVGQVMASAIVACESYVAYHYIFEKRSGIL